MVIVFEKCHKDGCHVCGDFTRSSRQSFNFRPSSPTFESRQTSASRPTNASKPTRKGKHPLRATANSKPLIGQHLLRPTVPRHQLEEHKRIQEKLEQQRKARACSPVSRELQAKMSTAARRRLMRDFKRMQTDPPAGVSASPIADNVMTWYVGPILHSASRDLAYWNIIHLHGFDQLDMSS